MYTQKFKLQFIEGVTKRRLRRAKRAGDAAETAKQEENLAAIQACLEDDLLGFIVAAQLDAKAKKDGLSFDEDGDVMAEDETLLDIIKRWLEWLSSDETLAMIKKLAAFFSSLFAGL